MSEMRVTSAELHQKLGQTIDKARQGPVMVTRHDRDHVVILAAEDYEWLLQASRKARLTGSLTAQERAGAASANVAPESDRKLYLAQLAAAVEARSIARLES